MAAAMVAPCDGDVWLPPHPAPVRTLLPASASLPLVTALPCTSLSQASPWDLNYRLARLVGVQARLVREGREAMRPWSSRVARLVASKEVARLRSHLELTGPRPMTRLLVGRSLEVVLGLEDWREVVEGGRRARECRERWQEGREVREVAVEALQGLAERLGGDWEATGDIPDLEGSLGAWQAWLARAEREGGLLGSWQVEEGQLQGVLGVIREAREVMEGGVEQYGPLLRVAGG